MPANGMVKIHIDFKMSRAWPRSYGGHVPEHGEGFKPIVLPKGGHLACGC